jgi:hypothetical protein
MSIKFGYTLSDLYPPARASDPSSVSELDLRYDYFCGDIEMRVGAVDFSARWGWVPILDFLASLTFALAAVRQNERAIIDFTENEDEILLVNDGDGLHISASHVTANAVCDFNDFEEAANLFARHAFDEISNLDPELASTVAFQALRHKVLGQN